MKAVLMPHSENQNQNQSVNPYRQIRNQKRNNSMNRSRPTENFGNVYGGLYLPHPYQSYSFPPSGNPIFQMPPLLPLPNSRPYSSVPNNKPNRTKSLTYSSVPNNRPNRTKSLTPKKPKQPMKRREDPKQTSSKPYRSEQIQLPYDLDKFSGSVFTLSPPPSSLPLPKFLPRRELSCKAEAGGVDAGASNNLRQMLRLR